VSRSF